MSWAIDILAYMEMNLSLTAWTVSCINIVHPTAKITRPVPSHFTDQMSKEAWTYNQCLVVFVVG